MKKEDVSSKWSQIDDRYMTEESESEEEENIRDHKLPCEGSFWKIATLSILCFPFKFRSTEHSCGQA